MFSLRTLHLDSEVLVAVEGCLHWLMMLGYLNKENKLIPACVCLIMFKRLKHEVHLN